MKRKWPTRRLGDFCSFTSGGTPSKSEPRFWNGDVPFVTARDLKSDRIDKASLHISRQAVERSATKLAPIGSLLMLVRGMGLANGVQLGEVTAPVAFNQDIKAIHPPMDSVLPRYLLLAIRTAFANGDGESAFGSAAHGTLKIDTDALLGIEVPLPTLAEQRRIVAVLDEAFTSIAIARAHAQDKLTALDELKQSLLYEAFSGKL